jgi:CRP/FNR family transcriptional regulator
MEQKKTELNPIAKRMKRIIHFKDYSDRDLLSIVRAGNIRRYPAGKIIYHEGGSSYGLGVLFKGEVHLYKLGPRGQENIISVIKPVIMFNEISAIDGYENPETAVAYKNCIIWNAPPEVFKAGLDRFPELGLGLLPVLARRNRRLISKYADLSFRPVSERVAILLLSLSEHGKKKIIRKENSIQHMAALVVTDPVVISRKLGEFKEAGVIECDRSTIIVQNPEKLAHFAKLDMETVYP